MTETLPLGKCEATLFQFLRAVFLSSGFALILRVFIFSVDLCELSSIFVYACRYLQNNRLTSVPFRLLEQLPHLRVL